MAQPILDGDSRQVCQDEVWGQCYEARLENPGIENPWEVWEEASMREVTKEAHNSLVLSPFSHEGSGWVSPLPGQP